jgi:hypothetical protein
MRGGEQKNNRRYDYLDLSSKHGPKLLAKYGLEKMSSKFRVYAVSSSLFLTKSSLHKILKQLEIIFFNYYRAFEV